ncbi:hypothetical protein EJ06DRAFT_212469 [Trichodelitschia bisporula]|uniref:Yeast cell wall synthesis Kre9/Knh1-like N-terminal domain-containing protein n=1 Tax=Trichodelitschia bisporula TaxID=703511 RepID=A0A6G1I8S8_9PEZI|nr:hypothetical protein EJ06DRAFT_212469 [Trichodelitschia bisporula]
MFSRVLYVLAAGAALASAYTTPVAQCTDSCNPIAKPGLQEAVPAGTTYTITWTPTTPGTVTILLLRGPAENIKPLGPLVEGYANSGTFSWAVSSSLEADVTHYGLQIINDADGTYQFSTQFGISNSGYSGSASASASTTDSAYPTLSVTSYPMPTGKPTGMSNSTASYTYGGSSNATYTSTESSAESTTFSYASPTGPTAAASSTTASKPAQTPNAAAGRVAGGVGAVLAFVAALAVF